MKYEAWTAKSVEHRVLEAAETELALPKPRGPQMFGSSMPDLVRERQDAYGYTATRIRRVPSPGAIARYDVVLDWLVAMPSLIDREFLWFWAVSKVSPKRSLRSYANENGINSRTMRRQITAICQQIANDLNRRNTFRLTMPIAHVSENPLEADAETVSSVSYATHWMAPGAKPQHLPDQLDPVDQRKPAPKREG